VRLAWLAKNGSVANHECSPLSFDLVWDFTRKEINTFSHPSSSVEMTIKESYQGCAMLTRYQGSKELLSGVEFSAPSTEKGVSAKVTHVNANFGLSRPHPGLMVLGDEFSTVSSRNTGHYILDLTRRQFGFEYACHHAPVAGADPNEGVGSVFMPFVSPQQKLITPPGGWDLMMPYISKDDEVELGNFLSCKQIEEAFNAKSTIVHRFPFKDLRRTSIPSGDGGSLETIESIDGEVKIRIGFDMTLDKKDEKKQCDVTNGPAKHKHLHTRNLARIGGKGSPVNLNYCKAIEARMAEDKLMRDVFLSPNLRKFHKNHCHSTGLDYPDLVQKIFNVLHSMNIGKPTDVANYLNSLSMQDLNKLVFAKTTQPQGATTAIVPMETDPISCVIYANIINAQGQVVNRIPVSLNHRARYPSRAAARNAAAQMKKTKAAVQKTYEKREGKEQGKVNFEADLNHEQKHADQCRNGFPLNMTSKELAEIEVEAYESSSGMLLDMARKAKCK
jgi:hypothetical protein